jgi:RNA polymerase sigma-70 factor (ECF subfamily)
MPPVTPRRPSGTPLDHLSDDLLMVRMGRGEASALRVLVVRHQGAAYRYCWRIFRDHHAAEDLAQELFVKIFRSAQRYQPQGHFTTYFYRVLANVCYDALRKRKRRRRVEAVHIDPVESEGTELEPLARLADVDAPLETAEAKDAVHAALGRLPVEVRKALELREFEGLRYREIASVLDLSLNEVKVLLHRGRKLLARALLATPVGRDWSAPAREPDDHDGGEAA